MRGRLIGVVLALVAGCVAPSASDRPLTTETLRALDLRIAPADMPCLMANMPPSVALRMDAAAGEDVLAIGLDGASYLVWWSIGFTSGQPGDASVLDPTGQVAARNGEILVNPGSGFPRLHGYPVCFGGGSFLVLARALS